MKPIVLRASLALALALLSRSSLADVASDCVELRSHRPVCAAPGAPCPGGGVCTALPCSSGSERSVNLCVTCPTELVSGTASCEIFGKACGGTGTCGTQELGCPASMSHHFVCWANAPGAGGQGGTAPSPASVPPAPRRGCACSVRPASSEGVLAALLSLGGAAALLLARKRLR